MSASPAVARNINIWFDIYYGKVIYFPISSKIASNGCFCCCSKSEYQPNSSWCLLYIYFVCVCQDCGLQLTDDTEKRCYPLNGTLLCQTCHLCRLTDSLQVPTSGDETTSNRSQKSSYYVIGSWLIYHLMFDPVSSGRGLIVIDWWAVAWLIYISVKFLLCT